jgi:hypothetical protein
LEYWPFRIQDQNIEIEDQGAYFSGVH